MIPAIIIFGLALVFISGAMFAWDSPGWAAVWATLGVVPLAVIYSGMIRLAEQMWERENNE